MVAIHEVSTVAAAVVVLITTAAAILAVIDVATPTPTTEKGITKLPIINSPSPSNRASDTPSSKNLVSS